MSAPTHIAFRDAIIKELEKTAYNRRPSQVFEEWVALVHANLIELPRQAAAALSQQPPGWSPGDYIQQALFPGEDSATREPAPVYVTAGQGGIRGDVRATDRNLRSRLAGSGNRRHSGRHWHDSPHHHPRRPATAERGISL